jgi:pyrophosphate--fructose-6-phosphate 1-phosphotransferase
MTLMKFTPLQEARRTYTPKLPKVLQDLFRVHLAPKDQVSVRPEIQKLFPHLVGHQIVRGEVGISRSFKPLKVGVVFSGGPAPGGHNVVAGLFKALKSMDSKSCLFGFLDGPSGIIEGRSTEITESSLAPYHNQGGFDLLGSGRTKIETQEQLQASLASVQKLGLDGLVVIGGDDSNTNAAVLAEYFLQHACQTRVVGVPKTIDGDLKNSCVALSFGFDTATKVYAELIGNLARDALSSRKGYHFVRLMGRSASHITLECALATHPNLALISEEKKTLSQIVGEICTLIQKRAELGKNYGVILIPEGLIEMMPGFMEDTKNLPERIQAQLLLERERLCNRNRALAHRAYKSGTSEARLFGEMECDTPFFWL